MYQDFIKKYVHYLNIHHIKDYAKSKNIMITDEEAIILCDFIKENYHYLMEDNSTILKLKNVIRDDLYKQVFTLYQENKTKYF